MVKHRVRGLIQTYTHMAFTEKAEFQWYPPMDVVDTGPAYVVRLEVPGMRKKDLRLGFRDNTLTIRGERRREDEADNMSFLRMEMEYGEFHREIQFQQDIQREAVQAHYQEGILKVVLPKDGQQA